MTLRHRATVALFALLSSLCIRAEAQAPCTLCPGGESAPDPTVVAASFSLPCGDIETKLAPLAKDGDSTCSLYQMAGVSECGCDRGTVREDACQFCGGADLADPAAVSSIFAGVTCGDLQLEARLHSEGSESCPGYQYVASADCGCPASGVQNPCSMCPGGEPAPNAAVDTSFGLTCGDIDRYAPLATDGDETCSMYQIAGVAECGCDRGPVREGACQFCGGAELADPAVVTSIFAGKTCGDLRLEASFYAEGSETCTNYQYVASADCGCSATPDETTGDASTTALPIETTAGASTTTPPVEMTAGASTTAPPDETTTTATTEAPDSVGVLSGAAGSERALSAAVIIAASILLVAF